MALLLFDKRVNITNARLHLLHNALWCITFVVLTVSFFVSRKYMVQIDISKHIDAEIKVSYPNLTQATAHVEHAMVSSDYCTSPGKYDYVFTPEFEFLNYTCMPVCPRNIQTWQCLSIFDMGRENLNGDAMIVTAIQDRYYRNPAYAPRSAPRLNYWALTADLVGVHLQYSYKVDDPGILGRIHPALRYNFDSQFYDTLSGHSSATGDTGLTTYILDSRNRIWRVVPPAPTIYLTVPEILELTGDDAALDVANELGTNNLRQDAEMPGKPLSRLTGMRINTIFACYSGSNPNLRPEELGFLDDAASVCTLQFKKRSAVFVYTEQRYSDDGVLSRTYFGIVLHSTPEGQFEFIDINKLFVSLVTSLIVLGYPGQVVLFITLNFLGHLSKIYKRAIIEDFDISDQVAVTTARLTRQAKSSHWGLDNEMKETSMSFGRFLELVGIVFSGRSYLDETEVNTLAHYCFRRLDQRRAEGGRSLSDFFLKLLGLTGWKKELTSCQTLSMHSQNISMDSFLRAYHSTDCLALDDLARLFERDRKVSIRERVFTPRQLHSRIYEANEARKVSSTNEARKVSSTHIPCDSHELHIAQGDKSDHLQERLEATERRLAETERSLQAWEQLSRAMTSTISTIQTRLQEVELQIRQPQQSDENSHSRTAEALPRIQPCIDSCTDELQARVSLLEHLVLKCNLDKPDSQPCAGPAVVAEGGTSAETENGQDRSAGHQSAWIARAGFPVAPNRWGLESVREGGQSTSQQSVWPGDANFLWKSSLRSSASVQEREESSFSGSLTRLTSLENQTCRLWERVQELTEDQGKLWTSLDKLQTPSQGFSQPVVD